MTKTLQDAFAHSDNARVLKIECEKMRSTEAITAMYANVADQLRESKQSLLDGTPQLRAFAMVERSTWEKAEPYRFIMSYSDADIGRTGTFESGIVVLCYKDNSVALTEKFDAACDWWNEQLMKAYSHFGFSN